MSLFVVVYVWQNVEVMKIQLDYKKKVRVEKRLIKKNDRLVYEIERMRSLDAVEKYAFGKGFKRIAPDDFDVLVVKEKNGKKLSGN